MKKSSITSLHAAWIGWVILSLSILLSLILVELAGGEGAIGALTPTGPLSKFWLTAAAVVHAWLLGGALLWLLKSRRIHRGNALAWAGFFMVSLLYVNLLRERTEYGDLDSYIRGATNLHNGEPFDNLYIYPPLWAMLLKPLVPYGENAFLYVTWNLNLLMLMLFYPLLLRMLERYGFSPRLAAVLTTLFMLVNMPLLRTLFYLQINLHVLNLIFLSVLAYPRARPWSALALALAIHLKVSPAALVLAFLLERDWRWLAWLAFFGLGIFGLTVLSDGLQPYVSYLHNLSLLDAARPPNFRETSFDSFFWSVAQFAQLDPLFARLGIYAAKIALTAAVFAVLRKAVQQQSYSPAATAGNATGTALLNALPPLLILMNMLSPLVWEHHAVFLVVAFMVLLRGLHTPAEWTWFGILYFVEFLIPTIDFFPWSYLRMLAPLLLLWLLWRTAGRKGETPFFHGLNGWLDKLPAPLNAEPRRREVT